jgi:hypothetical protein
LGVTFFAFSPLKYLKYHPEFFLGNFCHSVGLSTYCGDPMASSRPLKQAIGRPFFLSVKRNWWVIEGGITMRMILIASIAATGIGLAATQERQPHP